MAADGASVSGHDRGAVGSEAAARRRLGRNVGRRALSDRRRHLCKHNMSPFAAERRRRRVQHRARSSPAAFPDRRPLSSKPACHRCCCRSTGQTDRRTDGRTPDRYMDSALHSMLTAPKINTLRVARDVLRNYCGSVDG